MPSLPTRVGERPRTTPTNPHTQLDQQPTDLRWVERLAEGVFALPGVVEQPSRISVPGARALVLAPGEPGGPPEAFLIDREFAHLHPAPDHSLHAMLPTETVTEAVAAGWAEPHPVAPERPHPSDRGDALRPPRRGGAGGHREPGSGLLRVRSPRLTAPLPIV
jgi:hypothetical protein